MKRTANKAPNDLQAEWAKIATAQMKILILWWGQFGGKEISNVIPTSSIFQPGTVGERDFAGTIEIMRKSKLEIRH